MNQENKHNHPDTKIRPMDQHDGAVIQKEIKRRSLKPSQKERNLWQQYGRPPSHIPQMTDIMLQEAHDRLEQTFWLMEQSENPFFKKAVKFLIPFLKSQGLTIDITQEKEQHITTKPNVEFGRLIWIFEIPAEAVFFTDPIQLAIILTHEIEHLRSAIDYDRRMQSLSVQERFLAHAQHAQDTQEYIAEETRAYSVHAQASIRQCGLMGKWPKGSKDEKLAVAFIKSGSRVDSPAWRQYLIKDRLDIQDRKRQTP